MSDFTFTTQDTIYSVGVHAQGRQSWIEMTRPLTCISMRPSINHGIYEFNRYREQHRSGVPSTWRPELSRRQRCVTYAKWISSTRNIIRKNRQ